MCGLYLTDLSWIYSTLFLLFKEIELETLQKGQGQISKKKSYKKQQKNLLLA